MSRAWSPPGVVGKTWQRFFRVFRDGEPVDLTSLSLSALAAKPDGTTFVVPTATAVTPQIDTDKGRLSVTFSAAQLDTEGEWIYDLFIGPASGTVEFLIERRFKVRAKETHA